MREGKNGYVRNYEGVHSLCTTLSYDYVPEVI